MIQIRYSISGKLISFISYNAFAMFILHWPVMLLIRWVFYQQLGLAPVPTIVLMFVGGLTLSMIIVWKVKRFKTPFIKEVSKVVLGV